MRIGAAGRSVHHSRVDGNLMAVVERENSSLPLYLPIVHQASGDSIRQPFDCELILSLSGYCGLTAHCYCCHFSVASHDKLSACRSCAAEEVFSEHRCWFHPPCRRGDISMYVHTRARSSTATLFSHPRTHRLWLCFFLLPPTSGSLSYSWAICLGKCCVRCVSNRTSSVPLYIF